MFQAFQNLGISSKLRVVIVASSVFTLLLASVSVLTFQWWNIRQEVSRDLLVQSQILASNSTAALKFQDEKAAAEMLAALKANPHVLSGSLFQSDGKLLARHGDATSSPAKLSAGMVDGLRFQGSHVEMLHSVVFEGKRIGALYLRFDYRAMERAILLPFLLIMGGIFAAASLAALALAAALHPLISNPIARLTKAALAVADKRDYSVRVVRQYVESVVNAFKGPARTMATIVSVSSMHSECLSCRRCSSLRPSYEFAIPVDVSTGSTQLPPTCSRPQGQNQSMSLHQRLLQCHRP